jgi:hypothetical protein
MEVSLAQLLLEPTRLAMESLARWHGEGAAVQLVERITASSDATLPRRIALVERPSSLVLTELLELPRPTTLQHRSVRLSTSRGTVGVAYSAVVLSRIDEEERRRLTHTAGSLGRMLQPRGVRRQTLSMRLDDHSDPEIGVVQTRTLLYRGTKALGYVHEKFYSQPMNGNSPIGIPSSRIRSASTGEVSLI